MHSSGSTSSCRTICCASEGPCRRVSRRGTLRIPTGPDHEALGGPRGGDVDVRTGLYGFMAPEQLAREQAAQEDRAWVIWLSCGGCEGCTMSVLGATSPRLEELLAGGLTHIPRVEFIHLALSLESGDQYIEGLKRARLGELDPFILVLEGSLFDERLAGDGSFSSLGRVAGRTVPVEDWVAWLAPRAAGVIAIGTCATWGGIPAAR